MKAGVRLSEPLQSELNDPLYRDPDFAELYDFDNDGRTDLNFCAACADGVSSVLDLGCGTGVFLTKLDDGLQRAGVDPAEAMIAIARRRPEGEKVQWYAADARTIRLGCKFDLVVMTGHAFQVFLTEEDQFNAILTVAEHLSESGRFIFDTRNPAVREWSNWKPDASKRQFTHPFWGVVHAWNDVEMDDATGIANYETAYEFANSGRVLSARSLIRFTEKARVGEMLRDAGLVVENWLGDWTGEPFGAGSTEIIPIGKLA